MSRGVVGDIGIKVPLHVTFYCGGEMHKLLNCRVIRLHYVLRALGVLVEYFMRTALWERFVLIRNGRPHNAGSRLHFTSLHFTSLHFTSYCLLLSHILFTVLCLTYLLLCLYYVVILYCVSFTLYTFRISYTVV